VHSEIIKQLQIADLVMCDMSSLNANVFFELGIRTAQNKAVSLVVDEISVTDVPFDTKIINYYQYSSNLSPWRLETELPKLTLHIQECLERSSGQNNLWKTFSLQSGVSQLKESFDKNDKIDMMIMEIESLKNRTLFSNILQNSKTPVDKLLKSIEGFALFENLFNNLKNGNYTKEGDSIKFGSPIGWITCNASILELLSEKPAKD
jgi:hypothetical protein